MAALEARAPVRVDEVRVEREVELDVAAAGLDRVGDQLALDRDPVLDELVVRLVRAGRDAERVDEDRGGRKGDLERPVGDSGQERGPRGGAVHAAQPSLDGGHHQDDGLAPLVPELDRGPVGGDSLDRVVEGVEEHPAPKLPVGDDVEPDVGLAPDDTLDGRVGDGAEVGRVGALIDRRQEAPAAAAGCRPPRRGRGSGRSWLELRCHRFGHDVSVPPRRLASSISARNRSADSAQAWLRRRS